MKRIGQHTRALATIHDLLTEEAKTHAHTDSISTKVALGKLIPLLQATTGGRSIRYDLEDFRLPVREGASLALLVSELVSNAVKHGHHEIELILRVNGDTARLEVCDDGPGFPPGFEWRKAANTGLELIDSTGRYDLRGTISYENRLEGGARVVVTFPIPANTTQKNS
jgi:two-component sensor histidine kinase